MQEKRTEQKGVVKLEKETRAMPVKLEVRQAEENGKRTIAGAIKYDTDSAEMRDGYGDIVVEQIVAGAFTDSLKIRDVVGLWSHDTGQVIGNTKSGTLRIQNGEKELRFELDIPNTTVGNDAWELIRRGDVDGVSFGMRVTKDKWTNEKQDENRIYKRLILGAELYEISPVAFPAYPANEVSTRSLEQFKSATSQREKEKLWMELDLM